MSERPPRPRRILFLSNDVRYLFRFRGPLIERFRVRGYDVWAVAPPGDKSSMRGLSELGAHLITWPLRKAGRNPFVELIAIASLMRIFLRIRPDIFFGYTIKPVLYGLALASLIGVPRRTVMITGLGYAFMPGGGPVGGLLRALVRVAYRLALRQAHVAIFQNLDDVTLLRERGILTPASSVAVVNGSGVDLDHYAFTPLPSGSPVFLFVGRLLRDKGVREFVGAARLVRARLPHARFVLVGGQDPNPNAVTEAELSRWASEGLVECRGHLADVRPEYRAAHVFVLPSYREGTPRTSLEAMATGRAIITTDVPGCRETVVPGRNGVLVPPRVIEALAEAMVRIGGDLKLARRMGLESRAICAERFELGRVAQQTVSLIENSAEG